MKLRTGSECFLEHQLPQAPFRRQHFVLGCHDHVDSEQALSPKLNPGVQWCSHKVEEPAKSQLEKTLNEVSPLAG